MSECHVAHKLPRRGGHLLQSSGQDGGLHLEGQFEQLDTSREKKKKEKKNQRAATNLCVFEEGHLRGGHRVVGGRIRREQRQPVRLAKLGKQQRPSGRQEEALDATR